MTSSYDAIMQLTVDAYSSSGTQFSDGLRIGEFSEDYKMSGSSLGTHGVNVQTYDLVPATSTDFIPSLPIFAGVDQILLNDITIGDSGIEKVYIEGTYALKLDCSRSIQFELIDDTPSDCTITVSMIDDYLQKLTCQTTLNAGNGYTEFLPKGCRYITNISANSVAGGTLKVSTSDLIELPFTDYGVISPLVGVDGAPLYQRVNAGPPYQVNVSEQYYSALWKTPSTLTSNGVRPLIGYSLLWDGTKKMSVAQALYGYGFNPYFPPEIVADELSVVPLIETNGDLSSVIGIPQYSEGWLPWAG